MKKVLTTVLSLTLLLAISGCGKEKKEEKKSNDLQTLTCTKTEKEDDGSKTESTLILKHQDNKVKSVEETELIEASKEVIDFSYQMGAALTEEFNKIDGMSITYEKVNSTTIKSTTKVDFDKLNLDKLKELLGDDYDDSEFSKAKTMTVDEFKKEELEDYSCK